jgi:hypothetical protein
MAPAVSIHGLANAPASTWTRESVPVTVQVSVPAVAVTVSGDPSVAVPVAVPETVTSPVPSTLMVYCCAVVVMFCVTGTVELRKRFVRDGQLEYPNADANGS